MRTLQSLLFLTFIFIASHVFAQENYTIQGEEISLYTEVEGDITLLWNVIDGEYRYFIKKGNTITELKNTQVNKDYQEEYKQVLQEQTSDQDLSVKKIKLTKGSLKPFFIEYNSLKDSNYDSGQESIKIKLRLGAFIGITNVIYTENPDNQSIPSLGLDFEIVDHVKLKRHSLLFQFEQTFEASDYKYSSSEFSLNYRFKFIKKERLDVFINTKLASYTHEVIPSFNDEGELEQDSGDSFNAHLNFGLGLDYALGNGYLTFQYGDIVSITDDTNGEFPIDFTLGYKFNL